MKNCLTLLGILLALNISAQTLTWNTAYDRAQKARGDAEDLWNKTGASKAEIDSAIGLLKGALVFLDSVPVKDLEFGSIYLKFRRNDVTRDLARAYAATGRKELALETLERWYALGNTSVLLPWIRDDSAFLSIKNEPRFQHILDMLKNEGTLWNKAAFKSPYAPDLSPADKVSGLSLLWSMAKYNFVHFDLAGIDWNQTYKDFLPQVLATHTTADYYRVLIRFFALLRDGHTNVYVPDSLASEFYSRPPFRAEQIEGRVFVSMVYSDSLLKTGIKPGLEILEMDGEPVTSYADKYIRPYQSSSTPQDLQVREYTYALFTGPAEKPIQMKFRDAEGKISMRTIPRSGYGNVNRLSSVTYETIGDIGCLTINNFEDHGIPKKVDSLFDVISKTRGLIIDIRNNGGGGDDICFKILAELADSAAPYSLSKFISHSTRPGFDYEWIENPPGSIPANPKLHYGKPVVLLIGPRTFSAAEDFVVVFDYMKRGKMVGLPTGGSTGYPLFFDLPGGGTARICAKHDTYPDGKEFVGIGISPDVTVPKTIKDIQNGVDAQKEAAIKLLTK